MVVGTMVIMMVMATVKMGMMMVIVSMVGHDGNGKMMIMTVMMMMVVVVRPCLIITNWTAFPTARLPRAFIVLRSKGQSPRGGCQVQNFLTSLIMEQPVNISHMVQGTLNLSTQNEGPRQSTCLVIQNICKDS